MEHGYSCEKNVLVIISFLKAHGINTVIASPGASNITFVASIQNDPFFEIYSCVDERSAAYMACGIAAETKKNVVLTCTGATSSRNYMPGLTEAYYRKLPILVLSSTWNVNNIGHLFAQSTDRTSPPNDTVRSTFYLSLNESFEDMQNKVNRAILDLSKDGGGPVHMNIETKMSADFSVRELPKVQVAHRVMKGDNFPSLPTGKIAVFVGSHLKWTDEEIKVLDAFCESHNAVVFCDQTSNYYGKYRVLSAYLASQTNHKSSIFDIDLLIHIGEISGDYYTLQRLNPKEVWRVSLDGEFRNRFGRLKYIFQMDEVYFFEKYTSRGGGQNAKFYKECISAAYNITEKLPELPFSNIWIASVLAKQLPRNAVLHLAILNTLRSWNFFEMTHKIPVYSNVGGFGIDGTLSTVIGSSFIFESKLHYAIIGDLAFFYDLNSLGNKHIKGNLRILLINNGMGVEFRNYNHLGDVFGDESNDYVAAAGHFKDRSETVVKSFVENLGFEYISASSQLQFLERCGLFTSDTPREKPIVFEVFIDHKDENKALELMLNTISDSSQKLKNFAKKIIRK